MVLSNVLLPFFIRPGHLALLNLCLIVLLDIFAILNCTSSPHCFRPSSLHCSSRHLRHTRFHVLVALLYMSSLTCFALALLDIFVTLFYTSSLSCLARHVHYFALLSIFFTTSLSPTWPLCHFCPTFSLHPYCLPRNIHYPVVHILAILFCLISLLYRFAQHLCSTSLLHCLARSICCICLARFSCIVLPNIFVIFFYTSMLYYFGQRIRYIVLHVLVVVFCRISSLYHSTHLYYII
jgi:hypothetical protein